MKGHDAGFTLVEVVLILVIAAVAVLPLGMLFANTSIRSGDARNAMIAAQLAQSKMEELTADKNSPSRGFSYLIAANYPKLAENALVAALGIAPTTSRRSPSSRASFRTACGDSCATS